MQSAPVDVGKARFVGFSWPDPDAKTEDGTVWMRSRDAGGWSAWREVEQAGDGPDANSSEYRAGRAYSDGQWLEAGTVEVQVRVDPPSGAEAKAGTNAEAGAKAGIKADAGTKAGVEARAGAGAKADAGAKAGKAGAANLVASGLEAHLITPDLAATPGTEAPRAGVATAATARPRIISRAAWGARESIRRAGPDYSDTVKAAVIHHTVQSNSYSPSESAALVRSDYLYHVRTRGWNDIGYNFLVDRYGRVFEGRTAASPGPCSAPTPVGSTPTPPGSPCSGPSPPPGRAAGGREHDPRAPLDLLHHLPGRPDDRPAGRDPRGRVPDRAAQDLRRVRHRLTGQPRAGRLCRRACPLQLGGALAGHRHRVEWGHGPLLQRPGVLGQGPLERPPQRRSAGPAGVGHHHRDRVGRRPVGPAGDQPGVRQPGGGAGRDQHRRVHGRGLAGEQRQRRAALHLGPGVRQLPLGPQGRHPGGGGLGRRRHPDGRRGPAQRGPQQQPLPAAQRRQQRARLLVRPPRRPAGGGGLGRQRHLDPGGRPGRGVVDPQQQLRRGGRHDRHLRRRRRQLPGRRLGRRRRLHPGVQRKGTFWLRNTGGSGPSEVRVRFGRPTDVGFAGDWNGNGTWTPGILRAGTRWYLKDSFAGTAAKVALKKQTAGRPVVGDWDNRP